MQQDKWLEIENRKKLLGAIATVVIRHRLKMDISVNKISAESSVNKATWLYIEKEGIKAPSIVALWKIAESFDMKPYELIKEIYDELGENFSLSGLN